MSLSISPKLLIEEATHLGLTHDVLQRKKNLFMIHSAHKSILFHNTDFGYNKAVSFRIANDKELAYIMLERAGLPTIYTRYITKKEYEKEGYTDSGCTYPLVVKPVKGAHGNGVMMNLKNNDQVVTALIKSFEKNSNKKMIVQNQVEGNEYRVMVMDDEVLVAYHRAYPLVTGDGISTIKNLIVEENASNTYRGQGYENALSFIQIDHETSKTLHKQGCTLDTVLDIGTTAIVRSNSNVGSGGTMEGVTDTISDTFKQVAIDAAKACSLRFAGVDILTTDITSNDISKCSILEVNATPGLGGDREFTNVNTAREILKRLFDM